MNKSLTAAAVGAAAGASLLIGASVPSAHATTTVPHCPTEDSGRNCTWNVRPGVDGNGYGLPFYVDRAGRVHYAPTCATITRTAGYEFPRKAHRAYELCRRNAGTAGIADHITEIVVERRHWRYVGRYDGHRYVWVMPGDTSVYVKRGWFETS